VAGQSLKAEAGRTGNLAAREASTWMQASRGQKMGLAKELRKAGPTGGSGLVPGGAPAGGAPAAGPAVKQAPAVQAPAVQTPAPAAQAPAAQAPVAPATQAPPAPKAPAVRDPTFGMTGEQARQGAKQGIGARIGQVFGAPKPSNVTQAEQALKVHTGSVIDPAVLYKLMLERTGRG